MNFSLILDSRRIKNKDGSAQCREIVVEIIFPIHRVPLLSKIAFVNTAKGAEKGSQCCPESFESVTMEFTKTVVACILPDAVR